MKTCLIVEYLKGPRSHVNRSYIESWLNKLKLDVNLKYIYLEELSLETDHDIIIAIGNQVSQILKEKAIDHFRLPHPIDFIRRYEPKQSTISRILRTCKSYIDEKTYILS